MLIFVEKGAIIFFRPTACIGIYQPILVLQFGFVQMPTYDSVILSVTGIATDYFLKTFNELCGSFDFDLHILGN